MSALCHTTTVLWQWETLQGLWVVHVHVCIMRASGLWCVHISTLNTINTLLDLSQLICTFDPHPPSIPHCHTIPAFTSWSSHNLIFSSLTATFMSYSNLLSFFHSFFTFKSFNSLSSMRSFNLFAFSSVLLSYHTKVNSLLARKLC